MRLDKAIFQRGLVQSRSRGEQLILSGCVKVNSKTVLKPASDVCDQDEISVDDIIGYVGRGGLKLEHAVKMFELDLKDKMALDIGASTGGFTQCLLENGAKNVVAVDVGHGQMHPSLASDPRVTLIENTNAKIINAQMIGGKKDVAVMDVSFISQTDIYPNMFACLNEQGFCVTLVKPQFELNKSFLNKKGIVKDKKAYLHVLEKIESAAQEYGFGVEKACVSSIKGGDGNTEFLVLFKRDARKFDFTKILNSL